MACAALKGVSLDVRARRDPRGDRAERRRQVLAVNVISGLYRADNGQILLGGESFAAGAGEPARRARRGADVPEPRAVPAAVGRCDNIATGLVHCRTRRHVGQLLGLPGARREKRRDREPRAEVASLLGLAPHLGPARRHAALRAAEAGRARPGAGGAAALLLLDEPMAGMTASREGRDGAASCGSPAPSGTFSIILIEHDIGVVMDLSDRDRRARLRPQDRRRHARPRSARDPAVDPTPTSAPTAEARLMDWYGFLFFVEVLVGGLLSGVMYSLVAIGFVLIYKTSGVLNFAQGAHGALRGADLCQPGRARRARSPRRSSSTLACDGGARRSPSSAPCCGRWSTARR